MKKFNAFVVAALTFNIASASLEAQAQTTGRIILGYAPGGAVGIMTTLTADKLRDALGHAFLHDNRAGGEGNIAINAVKAAVPDGNTLLMTPIANICIYPHTYKKLAYDAFKDFIPVAMVGAYDFALVTGPATPATSVAGFIEWAKANPKQASFGTPGAGNIPHIYGLSFARAAGITLSNVPYKGSIPAINDLMGGHLAAVVSTLGDFLTQDKAGRVRILAHSNAKRTSLAPHVPTFAELGYKGLQGSGWYGLFAPAGTPMEMVSRINRIVIQGQQAPDMSARMRDLALETQLTTPAEFATIVRNDYERWGEAIRVAGFAGSQ
jgi:tripartite-type tricarboxylate transporter receptor subunit TctC